MLTASVTYGMIPTFEIRFCPRRHDELHLNQLQSIALEHSLVKRAYSLLDIKPIVCAEFHQK